MLIISNMALKNKPYFKGGNDMMEKIYNTMKSVGVWNLVMGILLIITGIISGVFMILNGAKLLKKKSELLF